MDGESLGTPSYALSRSLYRELIRRLPQDGGEERLRAHTHRLLDACEVAMQRLLLDPETCANPARSLFREIRHFFAIDAQAEVWEVVRFHVSAGRQIAPRLQATLRRECQAVTRQGTPCRREPTPGKRFCPSHYALEDALTAEDLEAGETEFLTAA